MTAGSTATRWMVAVALLLAMAATAGAAGKPKTQNTGQQPLDAYLAKLPVAPPTGAPPTTGSLWVPGSAFAQLARDYKSYSVGDVVTILIRESTVATDSKSIDSQRGFAASSGISALAGQINTKGVASLFSPTSDQKLSGKGQSASDTQLQTRIAGQVIAVVSGGMVVLQAQRELSMNNEKQTVIVRGVARPGDIGPDNVVASTSLANLQIEVKGKGVLSDATHQPNLIVRTLLKLVGF